MYWGFGETRESVSGGKKCNETLHHTAASQQQADFIDLFRYVKFLYTSNKIVTLLNDSAMLRNV